MAAFDTMNSPAGPAAEPVEVFGQHAEPGDASASLDASRTYRVQVWAQDRTDSRERFDVATQCEKGDAGEWVEAYMIVLIHVMPYESAAERPAAGAAAAS
ncbi:hypothetical protein [Streptomyces sp. NPDC003710]